MSIFDRFKSPTPEPPHRITDAFSEVETIAHAPVIERPTNDFLNPTKNKFMGSAGIFGQRIATEDVAPEPEEPDEFGEEYYKDDDDYFAEPLRQSEIAQRRQSHYDVIGNGLLNKIENSEGNDILLRKLAKLKVTQLKFKVDIRTEPFRLGISEACKFLDQPETAAKVRNSETLSLKEFEDIIEDVIYLELKERQRVGERIMPTSDDLISQLVMQKIYGMTGEGFENAFDLLGGVIQKAKTKFGSKK